MNYIRHLTAFFDRVAQEDRLNPTHISLYMALFQFWNLNRFQNPISITRGEMMLVSKIHSKATYHKVIKDLHAFGLIFYKPSYNPFRGSEVELVQLDSELVHELNGNGSNNEQAVNGYRTKIETSTVLINEPPYKHINNTNYKLACDEETNNNTGSKISEAKLEIEKLQSDTVLKEKNKKGLDALHLPQSIEEIKTFFASEKSTTIEAQKFFNYFQSNGWKVGGRAPMRDWKAAARNWILNSQKYSIRKNSPVSANVSKNYGEPL